MLAGIDKPDDVGLFLIQKPNAVLQTLGRGLLAFEPLLMNTLSVLESVVMFLEGGGILLRGVPALSHAVDNWSQGLD